MRVRSDKARVARKNKGLFSKNNLVHYLEKSVSCHLRWYCFPFHWETCCGSPWPSGLRRGIKVTGPLVYSNGKFGRHMMIVEPYSSIFTMSSECLGTG